MNLQHAVVFLDDRSARVFRFEPDQIVEQRLHELWHYTQQHASAVRDEHEFFGKICDAMESIPELLVTGGHPDIAAFRQYVEKHRPKVAAHIVGYQVVDHPTEGTILELAQQLFMKVDRMVELGLPPAA